MTTDAPATAPTADTADFNWMASERESSASMTADIFERHLVAVRSRTSH